ncbi:hypothetical protein JOC78_002572 [Bacillus ectoiniformans]|uniref:hypothetical protein n=1 Tax=Bacillus ectoiniformans TaxID=1494429 RepID=UPI00195AC060|nr:hypothetical protein [Bacillus ectoiniformans]MBM7649598.1 hypothetical protein [Bacillus ectoiniformans]
MDAQSKGMAALLFIITVMITGMMLSSWRIIIYSYLAAMGVILAISLASYIQKNKSFILFPVFITGLFYGLFILADAYGLGSETAGGSSTSYLFGLVPTTAVFLYGIASMILIVPLLYAINHRKQESSLDLAHYEEKKLSKTS